MQKATGVDVDWSYMTAEQIQLALTGKDLPDAIFLYASIMDKATMYEYGQGGYFVNFMDYLDIMPNFSAVIEANPEALKVVQNEDGSVYCLPTLTVTSTGFNNLLFYRTDMMKEIGWEKAPATTDEFLQFVKELQAHYGKDDPDFIAVNAYAANRMGWSTKRIMSYFFPSFGELLLTEMTVDSNGKVVLGAATEQYKHLMEFMNELWESGAFDTNTLLMWAVIVVVVTILDNLLPIWFTKKFGGSKAGERGAMAGVLAGFIFGPVGIIVGPFIGAMLGELINDSSDRKRAFRSGWGSFLSFFVGTGIKLVVSMWLAIEIFVDVFKNIF